MPNITVIPDPSRTIEGLRDTGYSFETSVADLVDNSIAADADVVDISVQLDLHGQVRVCITDDGCGMDRDGLVRAMTYGSPQRPDPASLGKFGLGLKTASTAWCRRLSLISRPPDGPTMMATWDIDFVTEEGKWLLQVSDEPDEEAKSHLDRVAPGQAGTAVLWSKVDRLLRDYQNPTGSHAQRALRSRCGSLAHHLAMTFQRFLDPKDRRARNIHIRLNGEPVRAWDPFQKGYSELVADETVPVEISERPDSPEFTIRAYILPRREEFPNDEQAKAARISPDLQGIYVYREERLIHDATWLGMFTKEPHLNLLRVEFSFDHRLDGALQLDIRKSQIIVNDDLLKWLRDQFLTAPRREAQERYRKGRKKVISQQGKNSGHQESNRAIANKDSQIGGPTVSVTDPATGEVEVTNRQGIVTLKLPVGSAEAPGQVHVQPSDDVVDGVLFEPAIIEKRRAVRINTEHPYYHKVYVPNFDDSVTVQGLDSLLWALCVAELSATSNDTIDLFREMRFEVSKILRKLVEGLPEPPDPDKE